MKKTTALHWSVLRSILLAFGILALACKKDPTVLPVEKTCTLDRAISGHTLPGQPTVLDTVFYYYHDEDGDGVHDPGERIRQVYSDPDNHTDYAWEPGKVTIEVWNSGDLLASTVHTLDQNGRSVEEVRSNTFGAPTTILRTYDAAGYVAQTILFSDIADQTTGTYEWENGNLKRVVSASVNGRDTSDYAYYSDLVNTSSTEILPIMGKGSKLLVKQIVSTNGVSTSYTYILDPLGKIINQVLDRKSPTNPFKIESSFFFICN